MKKRMLYPMLGTALGAGAIIGSMLVRYFTTNLHPRVSHFMTYEVVANFYFYVYMGGGTTVVLMFSGFFIGKLQDGLIDKNRQLDLANQDLNELLHLHAESEGKYRQAIDQASDAILFVEIETAKFLQTSSRTIRTLRVVGSPSGGRTDLTQTQRTPRTKLSSRSAAM